MGYRTGVLRQQTVPGAARPEGVERAERGAGAPDGVVRGDTDGAVVCGRWPGRGAAGKGPPLVCPSGGADVQRYAGCAAAPDVAVPRLRAFGCRGALAGMRRNATPDAFRSGVEVRKTSPSCASNWPQPPGGSRSISYRSMPPNTPPAGPAAAAAVPIWGSDPLVPSPRAGIGTASGVRAHMQVALGAECPLGSPR